MKKWRKATHAAAAYKFGGIEKSLVGRGGEEEKYFSCNLSYNVLCNVSYNVSYNVSCNVSYDVSYNVLCNVSYNASYNVPCYGVV